MAPVRRRMARRALGVGAALALLATWLPLPASAAETCSGVRSDINGDGYVDSVVSDVAGAAGSVLNAGRVAILYGSTTGLATGPVTVLTQNTGGIPGTPQPGDLFGSSPVVEDLNDDGCADLVVGSPGEEVAGALGAGTVTVIFGAPGGINTGEDAILIDALDLGRTADPDAKFGAHLDAAQEADGRGLVAVGASGGRVGTHEHAGWAAVFPLFSDSAAVYSQDTSGIPGSAEDGDAFGSAIALDYLVGRAAEPDLVVGAPNEDLATLENAGTITVIPDPLAGGGTARSYSQNTPGVPGAPEAGDTFGYSLATTYGHGTAWLAVGVPGEGIGSVSLAGAVQLFSSSGTLRPRANLHQNKPGVRGRAESSDFFGEVLSFCRPLATSGRVWLGVGTPHEAGAATATGLAQFFPIDDLDAERSYSQGTPGVPGQPDALDYFGRTLGCAAGAGETAFLVGAGDDNDFRGGMVTVIPTSGDPRTWRPGVGGVPAVGWVAFGSGLTG